MVHSGNSYEFFLSELSLNDNAELGYIIELMRAANHMKETNQLLYLLSNLNQLDEDEPAYLDVEVDSTRVFLFNMSAAQLREALHLFHKLSKLQIYNDFKKGVTSEQIIVVSRLEEYVNEFEQKKGLLYETLIPLRNKVFHYDAKAASEWGKQRTETEKYEKPPYYKISFEALEFGLGIEYDEYLFGKYLFIGVNGFNSILSAQKQIYEIHNLFILFLQFIVDYLMKRSNVPMNREFGWSLEHMYGFHKANMEK